MKSGKAYVRYRWEVWDTRSGTLCLAFSKLTAATADCAERNAGSPDTFAVREREPEARFGGKEGRSRGGQANGARKARSPAAARAAVMVRYARERARAEAHADLLEVAREVGSFLDDLALVDNSLRERGRDLSDRLYSAVSKVKGGK